MKDKEFNGKIDKLYSAVVKEEKNLSSSLNKALIFYLIIIIFIAAYTIYLNIRIKELATPANLAIAINTRIKDSIPRFSSDIKAQMKPGAKQMAVKSVEAVHSMIPKAATFAQTQINFYVDKFTTDIEKKHLPMLQEVFDASVAEVIKDKSIVKDKAFGKAIASELSKRLDKEICKIVNNSFINKMDEFKKEIDTLRNKKMAKMNKREYAEKMFMIYWLHLVERKELGGSMFSDVIGVVNDTMENLCAVTTVK